MRHRHAHQHKFFQKMVLTPQMRHSIQMLGMSVKDLSDYIDMAVQENPFLKKIESKSKSAQGAASDYSSKAYEYTDQIHQSEVDMRAVLLSQLNMSGLDKKYVNIAEHLVSELDDNGYIPIDVDICAKDIFESVEDVEGCLMAIQSLEPAGIGARDVRECLQIQLRRLDMEGSLEYKIVSGFLSEVATNDVLRISKVLGADKKSVVDAINNIKKLNPRPASSTMSKHTPPVIPDMLAKVDQKKVRLQMNRDWMPHLRLYNPYEDRLDIIKDSETRKFMKDNMDSARYLIDGLKRREETMCKVADYILNYHKEEVAKDTNEIKSLTIKNISQALSLHPSTINRAVSNKYIELNDRVVPLKSLLSHGLKKENGELESKVVVKKKIENIVKDEDKSRPLSDKAIQERLAKDGIMIKRRTVAKYRDSLSILPTYLRKKKSTKT